MSQKRGKPKGTQVTYIQQETPPALEVIPNVSPFVTTAVRGVILASVTFFSMLYIGANFAWSTFFRSSKVPDEVVVSLAKGSEYAWYVVLGAIVWVVGEERIRAVTGFFSTIGEALLAVISSARKKQD